MADSQRGRHCDDFRAVITTMLISGFVQYIAPQYSHMKVYGTQRIINVLMERTKATPKELEEAVALLTTHWNLANGKKEVCVECEAPAIFERCTQFAGNHPYCDAHARAEKDFGVDDGDSTFWRSV